VPLLLHLLHLRALGFQHPGCQVPRHCWRNLQSAWALLLYRSWFGHCSGRVILFAELPVAVVAPAAVAAAAAAVVAVAAAVAAVAPVAVDDAVVLALEPSLSGGPRPRRLLTHGWISRNPLLQQDLHCHSLSSRTPSDGDHTCSSWAMAEVAWVEASAVDTFRTASTPDDTHSYSSCSDRHHRRSTPNAAVVVEAGTSDSCSDTEPCTGPYSRWAVALASRIPPADGARSSAVRGSSSVAWPSRLLVYSP